ncbi:MAG: hypothetical protein ACOYNW_07280 [Undibacterium curvum]
MARLSWPDKKYKLIIIADSSHWAGDVPEKMPRKLNAEDIEESVD